MALISFPPDLHLYNVCPPGFPINRRASTLIRFLLDQVGKVGKGTRYYPKSALMKTVAAGSLSLVTGQWRRLSGLIDLLCVPLRIHLG